MLHPKVAELTVCIPLQNTLFTIFVHWQCQKQITTGLLYLELEHTGDAGSHGDHRVQAWSQSSHMPVRKSDFRSSTKGPCHVTFDLDLDLEHTVDVGSPGDHRVHVWSQSSHLPVRKSDFRSSTKVPVSGDL